MNQKQINVPARSVPVACEADVVVAGAGSAGLMAALAAARQGARVALVDRMPAPGGNMGPGMIVGATFGIPSGDKTDLQTLRGVAGEFYRRFRGLMDDLPDVYAAASHAASRMAIQMCREANVTLVLSAYAGDPIMDGATVRGLLVETKSGLVAFPANVVIDATGDADIACRAGAPVRRGCAADEISTPAPGEQPRDGDNLRNPEYPTWNDGQIYFYLGDAEIAKYVAFSRTAQPLTEAQRAWAKAHLRIIWKDWPDAMIPILMEGWESGEFQVEREVRPHVIVALNNWFAETCSRPTLMGGRAGIFGDYDTGRWEDVSLMEAEVRSIVHDGVRWFRKKKVPGFERAFIACMSPFFGARGGPFIEGEHVLTPREAYEGAKFPDACLSHRYGPAMRKPGDWFDWPYRCFLPRKVEGLLVCGRGMSFARRGHDSSLRGRFRMIPLGEVAGLAAAIAAEDGVSPRNVDVRKLQQAVHASGYFLGDAARLKELGVA